MRHQFALFVTLAAAWLAAPVQAQETTPVDGPQRTFRDSLLDGLAGTWNMSGNVRGKPARYRLSAEWVLNHQFLRVDMRDVTDPPAYQATVYIGYDNTSQRYVAHWLDTFGGRLSETLGYGNRLGASVRFQFEYTDGPFQTTFTHDPMGRFWTIVMESRTPAATWIPFARYDLRQP